MASSRILRVAVLAACSVIVAPLQHQVTQYDRTTLDADVEEGDSIGREWLIGYDSFPASDAAEVANSMLPAKASSHMRSFLRDVKILKPEQVQAQAMLLAYGVAVGFVVVCVAAMYYPMGFGVVLQIVLYICALAFVKLSVKTVFVGHGFFYPKFVTAVHLAASSLAGFAVMSYRSLKRDEPFTVPTSTEIWYGILPIAMTFGLSIGSENSALVFVSAAFSEVIGACSPVFSALLTVLMGMPFHNELLAPICVVILGCTVTVTGELTFSLVGTLLLLLGVVCRCFKAVMQQRLMTGETKERFDPVAMMAWTCLFSLAFMVVYTAATEGMTPIHHLATAHDLGGLIFSILISTILACLLNLSALFVVKHIGAVGMQLVAQMKSVLIVIGGIALLHETFTPVEFFGFGAVLSGVYWYSSMKMKLESGAKGH
eukprot:TRINITY_DN72062_c0_g1_i1.p1 TRINITY_DN72062_c0_g1~~TRINITY_DN72062_c0_g1_i1.p1  ORF type:complete len:429 (+),score=75.90 TRINITY_DN72062_c0_g1_i1:70-1356(+)